jgi:hypothetical protein
MFSPCFIDNNNLLDQGNSAKQSSLKQKTAQAKSRINKKSRRSGIFACDTQDSLHEKPQINGWGCVVPFTSSLVSLLSKGRA